MCDNCNRRLHLDSPTNSIAERSKKTRGETDRLSALLPFCDVIGCHCLSCNWLEYYEGSLSEQIQQVRNTTHLTYGATGRLVRLNVGKVIQEVAVGTKGSREVSIIHDPLDQENGRVANPSHALMTNVPDENDPQGELIRDIISNCIQETFPAKGP